MRFDELKKLIHNMAASAREPARRAFALDTISRLYAAAESAIRDEFTESERLLLNEIVAGIESLTAVSLKRKVKDLDDSQCRDPIRGIEFNPKLTQLVCALDSWADYRFTSDPVYVAHIAINMVNAVDYDIAGAAGEYSVENMLGAPEMVAEYHRQQEMLGVLR
jgi:hypothetical protein